MIIMQCFALLCIVAAFAATAVNGEDKPLFDCLLTGQTMEESLCRKRGCVWKKMEAGSHIPWCYLDTNKVGYTVKSNDITKRTDGIAATLEAKSEAAKSVPFALIDRLKLEVDYLSKNILRVRLLDSAHKRYEVPVTQAEFSLPNRKELTEKDYEVALGGGEFGLTIARKGTGAKIIDTSIGGLIYSDKFIQFATKVASNNVYGLGENYQLSLRHKFDYSHYPLFSRDRAMGPHEMNNYGVHPFYTVLENDGKAHGVLLINSNAMSYSMLSSPAISIKTTGGILDFLIFVGDNPEHVVKLYTSVIGKPVMPPFWSLGFQLCRYGYKNLDQVKRVVKRNLDNHVPLDVKYLDIDYMDKFRDFTYDTVAFAGLPEYIKETKVNHSFHWTLILDPAIEGDKPGYHAFDEGYKRDVFIKWPESIPPSQRTKPGNAPTDKGVMYGHVWPPGPAAFPDFFRNATRNWWIDMLKQFHKTLEFDSIWIDMNEPSNFGSEFLKCPSSEFDVALPSQNLENLNSATLCMTAVQGEKSEYRHYDVHSLFGWSQTKPTAQGVQAATGKRGFVVSRSTYPSSGKYAAHWLGDNFSTFEQMRQSIIGMLSFSLFGISFTGADICGFIGNTTPDLCRRWLQLGAYYPFSRSHNNNGGTDQDPGYWIENGHPEVTQAAVDSLRTRYQLLHYLYTAFYRSHVFGETLARPMHHEFPTDNRTFGIDQQFFLGSSILVNPFLFENQKSVKAYAPKEAEWYKLSKDFVESVTPISDQVTFDDSESNRPLLLRAGSILPVIGAKNLPNPLNTVNLRRAPVDLWVLPTKSGAANGELFYDDGDSIDTIENGHYNLYQFKLEKCSLQIKNVHNGYVPSSDSKDILKFASINVALSNRKPNGKINAKIDGVPTKSTVDGSHLRIDPNQLNLLNHAEKSISITFEYEAKGCIFD